MWTLHLYKSVYLILLICGMSGISVMSQAQLDTTINRDQFVFHDFSVGIVKLNNGEKVVLKLNYNIVTEKMVFEQGGKIFDIVNQASIDTVYMNEAKFVPVGKAFYEILVNKPVTLFLQNTGRVKAPSKPAAYGGTSEVSSSTYINNLKLGNDVFRMDHRAPVVIMESSVFWIRKDGKMYAITKRRQLIKLFPGYRNEIKENIKQNQLDIENTEELVKVVNLINAK